VKASFQPAGFASRYLNAVRVGARELDAAHERGEELTNACEQCPVNAACHSAFGEVNGYGLFPFNPESLERAIKSQSADSSFVARNVLTRVLRPVLHRDEAEINHGRFPSEGFARDFRAGASDRIANIEDQVRLHSRGDEEMSERRVRLVRFWGSSADAENLSPTIHDAFGVTQIDGLERAASPRIETATTPYPPPGISPVLPKPVIAADPPLVKAVDNWLSTDQLRQSELNELRSIVYTAVRLRLGFEDGYGGDSLWGNDRALAPGFEAKMVEFNQAKIATAILPMDKSNADDMRALRALAWANHRGAWAEVPGGEPLQRIAEAALDRWTTKVGGAILPPKDPRDDSELARLAEVLLSIARAAGIADAFKSDTASRLRALFAPVPSRADLDSRPGLRALHSFLVDGSGSGSSVTRVGRSQLQQRLLRHASYSQGSGKPLALDLSKVAKVVRSGTEGAPWPASTPDLIKSSVSTIETRLASIDNLRAEAANLLPDLSDVGGDLTEVASELLVLVHERAAAGALPGGIDPATLQAATKAVKSGDQRKVEAASETLSQWEQLTVEEKLQILNGDWDESARRVGSCLRMTRQAVRLLENNLASGGTSDVQREYAEARDRLAADLTALADSISGKPTEDLSEPEEQS
jgi:hypothetical protein